MLQVRDGVVWEDDERDYLVIGIASTSDEHIDILANLAQVIEGPETARLLAETSDIRVMLEHLNAPRNDE